MTLMLACARPQTPSGETRRINRILTMSCTSCVILSAGSDNTLRFFNTAVEAQNSEFSQKTMLKTLGLSRRHERWNEPTSL